jgi:uncharacterized membrane protein
MKKIRKYLLTGLIVSLPIILTVWILATIFDTLDSLLGDQITNIIGYKIPGLGLILGIISLLVVGLIASNAIGKKITKFIEKKFEQLPIIKTIYLPIKDILNNVSSGKSNNFKKAVFVEFPRKESLSIGFITKENVIVNGKEKTAIFIPTTPNPTNGFLVYLKKEDYQELDMPVDVALKSVISLGSISPDVFELNDCV